MCILSLPNFIHIRVLGLVRCLMYFGNTPGRRCTNNKIATFYDDTVILAVHSMNRRSCINVAKVNYQNRTMSEKTDINLTEFK